MSMNLLILKNRNLENVHACIFVTRPNKKVIIVVFWHKIKDDSVLELYFIQDTNWLFGERKVSVSAAATSLLVLPFPQETL